MKNIYIIFLIFISFSCLTDKLDTEKYVTTDLIDNQNFEFVNHDITKAYHRDNIDEIYNLACPASPIHYQFNPIKTVKTCTIGVINMLGLAKKIMQKFFKQVPVKFTEIHSSPTIRKL